jgi:hypothetical protein
MCWFCYVLLIMLLSQTAVLVWHVYRLHVLQRIDLWNGSMYKAIFTCKVTELNYDKPGRKQQRRT